MMATRLTGLAIISGVWFVVANWLCAIHTHIPPIFSIIPFAVTAALVIMNLRVAWFRFQDHHSRSKTAALFAALPATLIALSLLVLMLLQTYWHLDPNHFDTSDSPGLGDWAIFGLAHLLRAADVLDVLDKMGLNIQPIHHHSIFTSIVLVIFHLIAGLVVLELLWRAFLNLKESFVGSIEGNILWSTVKLMATVMAVGAAGGVVGLTLVQLGGGSAAELAPWSAIGVIALVGLDLMVVVMLGNRIAERNRLSSESDDALGSGKLREKPLAKVAKVIGVIVCIPLIIASIVIPIISLQDGVARYGVGPMLWWLLDNIMRVIDFTDVMVIFRLKAHNVGDFFGEVPCAIVIRMLTAIMFGVLVRWCFRKRDEPNRSVEHSASVPLHQS